jgi:hypothetical protein
MQQSWKSALDPKVEAAELDRLERALQRASVNTTVAALRRALPTPSAEAVERTVTIAALDGSATNQVAAILVAAAHQATGWMPEPAEAAEAMEVEAAAIAAAELAVLGPTMAVAAAAGEKKGEERKRRQRSVPPRQVLDPLDWGCLHLLLQEVREAFRETAAVTEAEAIRALRHPPRPRLLRRRRRARARPIPATKPLVYLRASSLARRWSMCRAWRRLSRCST